MSEDDPLGVVEGTTENTTVVNAILADLRDRGLDRTRERGIRAIAGDPAF